MQVSKVKVDFLLCLKDFFHCFVRQKISFWILKKIPKKVLGDLTLLNIPLQTSMGPPSQPTAPAPPAYPVPAGEAQTYILIFNPDYGCFRLEQQILGQKLRVFVCSKLLEAFDSNETLFLL